MSSLHIPPPAAGNARSDGSASSSNSHYTPVSNGSEEDYSVPKSGKSPIKQLRLQTDFGDNAETGGPVSGDEEEEEYDESDEDLERKKGRAEEGPKYTLKEEKEVVRLFDRRLVPFLAMLYLLAFLDRSSMLELEPNFR